MRYQTKYVIFMDILISFLINKPYLYNNIKFCLDLIVWSNSRLIEWVRKLGLEEYSANLLQSGVHGAVMVLDESFDAEQLAYLLQIPISNEVVSLFSLKGLVDNGKIYKSQVHLIIR